MRSIPSVLFLLRNSRQGDRQMTHYCQAGCGTKILHKGFCSYNCASEITDVLEDIDEQEIEVQHDSEDILEEEE